MYCEIVEEGGGQYSVRLFEGDGKLAATVELLADMTEAWDAMLDLMPVSGNE